MTVTPTAPGAWPPRLDDLTWEDITEATRRRIPAESDGLWTLHAPTDPGVTVLELFAYLLEQRLFWLDQVPDEVVVAVLRLLGLPGPLPARPAATVLQILAGPGETVLVPAGTVLSRDPLERITFTLDSDVAVLPLDAAAPRLIAEGRDRSADLAARRGVPLLPATGEAAEFRIELPLDGSPRPPRGTRLSLLFELATSAQRRGAAGSAQRRGAAGSAQRRGAEGSAQVPAGWSPEAVQDVTPPATLSWSWFSPDASGSVGDAEVEDGTAGLRRSGVVRLRLPDAWCEGGEAPAAYGLRVHTSAATYSAPPVLWQLAPNVGAARHIEARTATDADLADQIAAWLRLPGQRLVLPDARGLLLEASLRLRRDGEPTTWTAAPALTFAGPADRIFLLDRDSGELRFGDGLTGAIPVHDPVDEGCDGEEPVATVDYVLGGGAAGNGGQTANWFVLTPARDATPGSRPAVTARNVVPAEGGRDPETVARARRRAGEELGRVRRAVLAADFAELADRTPGVAVGRSYVGIGEHPSYPCTTVPGAVTVRVVPWVARGDADFEAAEFTAELRPDPGLLREVREHLDTARLLGTELFVCQPRYRRTDLRVDLSGRPGDPARVRLTVLAALRRFLDPLAGGDDGQGWPFGEALRPSALLRIAQAALEDAAEVTSVAIGVDGAPPSADCADVPLRPGDLPALRTVAVRTAATGEGRR